jgi:hypothetical protein
MSERQHRPSVSTSTRARLQSTLLLVACVLASGCLRAPIGDDYGDGSNGFGSGGASDEDGSSGIGWSDETGLDEGSGETTPEPEPEPACHPSYVPCLPVVDDLNCPDVVDLGAAPVMVVGPDDYGLDSDHDGVGCEP